MSYIQYRRYTKRQWRRKLRVLSKARKNKKRTLSSGIMFNKVGIQDKYHKKIKTNTRIVPSPRYSDSQKYSNNTV